MDIKALSGPIPGENFTSDTKNYPWHRPPEFDDVDKAIDHVAQKLTSEDTAIEILTLVQNKFNLVTITDMILTSGIGKGKWTPDMALLMAGPVAHILCIMCESDDIEYDLGVEEKSSTPTKAYFDSVTKDQGSAEKQIEALEPKQDEKPSGGFMKPRGNY